VVINSLTIFMSGLALTELIVEELKDTLMISVGWGRVKKDDNDGREFSAFKKKI
jgi:hypothetical protein